MAFNVFFFDIGVASDINRDFLEEWLGEDIGQLKEIYFEAAYQSLAEGISEILNVRRFQISELIIESLDSHTYICIVSDEGKLAIQEEFRKRQWEIKPSGQKISVHNYAQTINEYFSHTTNSDFVESSEDSKSNSRWTICSIEDKCKEIAFKELIKIALEKQHLRKCIQEIIHENSNALEQMSSQMIDSKSTYQELMGKINSLKNKVSRISRLPNKKAPVEFNIQRKTPFELRDNLLKLSVKVSKDKEKLVTSIYNPQGFEFSNLIVIERYTNEILAQIRKVSEIDIKYSFDVPYELLKTQGVCNFCVIFNSTRISNIVEFGICEFGVLNDTNLFIANRLTDTLNLHFLLKIDGKDNVQANFELGALKKRSISLSYKPQSLEIQAFSNEMKVSPVFSLS